MSTLFEAAAPSSSRRYLIAVLSRFRRFINRTVAGMLASRERQARCFKVRGLGDRELKNNGPHRTHIGIRTALLGVIIASLLSLVLAKADEPNVGDHRSGPAPKTTRPYCGGRVTAVRSAIVHDHRPKRSMATLQIPWTQPASRFTSAT